MRIFFLYWILISFSLYSCQTENTPSPKIDYTGFSNREVILLTKTRDDDQDTLGRLWINIPARLDTFYQWHNTSDCSNCGYLQYRFADKRYPQFAESGFFWTYIPDSLYQLTISYSPYRFWPDSIKPAQNTVKDTTRLAFSYSGLLGKSTYLKKEFREINGYGFLITAFATPYGELTEDTTVYLIAKANLKDREIRIIAECGAKDTAGFITDMYKAFLSIRIEEKQKAAL